MAPVAQDNAFLTVMLDVTANLLCTALVLLVLSLVVDRRTSQPVSEDVAVTTTSILTPAGLVAAFRTRTRAVSDSFTIDVGKAGFLVKPARAPPAGAVLLSRSDVAAGKLAPLLASKGGVFLFIFDQAGHGAVRAAIDEAGLAVWEVDVPLALRSAADAQQWSRGFQSLFGLDLDADAFQRRLQQILVGQGGAEGDEKDSGRSPGMGRATATLEALLEMVGFWWRFALVGMALHVFIRLRHGRLFGLRGNR